MAFLALQSGDELSLMSGDRLLVVRLVTGRAQSGGIALKEADIGAVMRIMAGDTVLFFIWGVSMLGCSKRLKLILVAAQAAIGISVGGAVCLDQALSVGRVRVVAVPAHTLGDREVN